MGGKKAGYSIPLLEHRVALNGFRECITTKLNSISFRLGTLSDDDGIEGLRLREQPEVGREGCSQQIEATRVGAAEKPAGTTQRAGSQWSPAKHILSPMGCVESQVNVKQRPQRR